ncbi:MAG TPA: hypothetical protein VMW57_04945 [Methyloceanibacter sp.]|nr:hypothetical protein [Methyloceanibacter sp.]
MDGDTFAIVIMLVLFATLIIVFVWAALRLGKPVSVVGKVACYFVGISIGLLTGLFLLFKLLMALPF